MRTILFLGLLVAGLPGLGRAQGNESAAERLILSLSPELRRMDRRLGEIVREMERLPEVREEPWGARYGHRSADLPNETTPDWVQLDLRQRREVDMVSLMPANLGYLDEAGAGHGFPKRFKVEISDYADMRDAVVLVGKSRADVPNPGRYPLVFEFEPVAGRHVRFTSLKHDLYKGAYFWALEELIVMEGKLIAEAGAEISMSSSMNLFPQWAPLRIIESAPGKGTEVTFEAPFSK